MSNEQSSLEIKVGIFVFVGLVAIAIMAVQFGRLGQGLSKFYELNVELPNASGLLKNSDVQLAGAVVGTVAEKPKNTPGHLGSVTAKLYIKETMKLPRGCTFQVGSSGMMGDKFVNITPPAEFDNSTFNPADPKQVLQPGETIQGSDPSGIEALTKKSEVAMDKLSANLDQLKIAIDKIQTNLLSDANLANVSSAFASIKTTGDNFAEASKKITDVVQGAQEAVNSAKETMVTVRGTVKSAEKTMATANDAANDIRLAISDARGAIHSAQTVLKSAQSGSGTIPMLLTNPEVAENLSALINNIRRHGLLFYRDSSSKKTERADEDRPFRRGPRPVR